MRFISPKTDFAFKKIFGSTDSKDILISFLNAILYRGEHTVKDLEIIDPYSASRVTGLKDTYLDVKAKITGNKTVIIQMQVLNVAAFGKRVLYNAAKTYATQLKSGEGYSKLNPVIALTITDFEMFENREPVISHFLFKENEYLFDYPNPELELFFVELPKFNKELDDLDTLTDKWIYFMKNTNQLEAVPETMGIVPEIGKALSIANQANLSSEELEDLEKREMFLEDQRGAIIKGRQEGIEEGRQEGRQEGNKKGKLELVVRLLERRVGEIAPDIQSRIRRLSIEQLENLGEAVLDFTSASDLTDWLQGQNNLTNN
ncbi:MAG: Rpn family recombination-promoting nuclease/putative transposase [Coleofasciculus sp. C3-bin4]|nr:Rpn family recombination-promoting nuclease/putative transposase [Coleofasciculus sp. C3-bin4]